MTRRGFTLIETLLAVAMLGALTISLFSFLVNTSRTRDRVLRFTSVESGATLFFDRLEDDLATCAAGSPTLGSGILGTSDSLQILARRVVIEDGAVHPASRTTSVYQHDADNNALVTIDPGASEPETLVPGVARVRFRYHDGSAWLEAFDCSERGLPTAVEASLWFGEPEVQPESDAPFSPTDPEFSEPIRDTPPDRVRIIVVPDAPAAPWKDNR